MVLETPQPNLVKGMKWLLGTDTGRFNRRHRLSGHLFGGRYKALRVQSSGGGYFRTVREYVLLGLSGTRTFAKSCWSRWKDGWERTILDRSGLRLRR